LALVEYRSSPFSVDRERATCGKFNIVIGAGTDPSRDRSGSPGFAEWDARVSARKRCAAASSSICERDVNAAIVRHDGIDRESSN